MTPQEAAEIIKRHNEWRRWEWDGCTFSNKNPVMGDPKQIGQAIDVLVAYVESQA